MFEISLKDVENTLWNPLRKGEDLTQCPWSAKICKKEIHYLPMLFARILSLYMYFLSGRDCLLLLSTNHVSEKTHSFLRIINSVILPIIYGRIIIRNERSEVNRLRLFRAFCCRYIEVTFSTYHTVQLCDEDLCLRD